MQGTPEYDARPTSLWWLQMANKHQTKATTKIISWWLACHRNRIMHFLSCHAMNTLRPRQTGRHFAYDILKCISLNENACIFAYDFTEICSDILKCIP